MNKNEIKPVSPLISPKWSSNRRVAVEKYVAKLQKIMRLADWTIEVDWSEPCEDISYATNDPMEDQKYAVIRVSDKFLDLSPHMQTQTLVHELTHCHLNPMTDLAEYTVKSVTSKATFNVFEIALSQSCEFATDALADVLAPLVPQFKLPELILDIKTKATKTPNRALVAAKKVNSKSIKS